VIKGEVNMSLSFFQKTKLIWSTKFKAP